MKYTKQCLYCNNNYILPYKNSCQKFCSSSCRVSNNNKNRIWKESSKDKLRKVRTITYRGSNNPNYKGGGEKRVCLRCKSKFIITTCELKSGKRKGIYCSRDCYFNDRIEQRTSLSQKQLNKKFTRHISVLVRKENVIHKSKWFKFIDYTIPELRAHLEKLFKPGMAWNNYGKNGWHIDHIKPVSYFKFESKSDKDFKECWSLSNLQPLWEYENLSKGGCNTNVNKRKYGKKN